MVGMMMAEHDKGSPVRETAPEAGREAERVARQRKRSIAIALSLLLLVALFYVATIIKLSVVADKVGS